MMTRVFSSLAIAVFLTPSVVGVATAQVRFEVGPVLGYYRPLGSFWPTATYAVTLPRRPSDKSGPALGARGRVWLSSRGGVELQVAQAWSTTPQVFTPAGPHGPKSVRVLTVATQGLYEVLSVEPFHLWLSAGGGLVRHGGSSYAAYDSPTRLAGTLGLGSGLRLHGGLSAELGLTDSFYFLDVRTDDGTSVQRGLQVDPVVHVGLTWGWSG
jgi:hypothetical protein